jgi:hypothetical protein
LTVLWTTRVGLTAVGTGLVMLVVGMLWMKAVVKVDV